MLRSDSVIRKALALFSLAFPILAAGPKVDFDREVRPILSDKCFTCHGPDENRRMAGLRLDTKDGAFAKDRKAPIITPGDPSQSRLIARISAPKRAMQMPPPGAGDPLTPKQIETITRWVEQGAAWETHWAYKPPQRPELPEVKNTAWAKNAIDRFILARLEREQLSPSPEADKTTLLRRVTLDLTGLPPTPAEVDRFLADKSPDAYEKRVDELLKSPHYGERMAMQWLDLARYADTHGYHIDSHRDMWPWRDWVIRSFNQNLPYDQFTIQQLAGDLLPNATRDQKVATGFNRNHMINFEGGAIPEEYQTEYLVDRVDATSTTFLGMTMGCARCHDHKYDPIRQKDFYRFAAFFNTIPEKGLDGRKGNAEPFLLLPNESQEEKLKSLEAQIKAAEAALPEKQIAELQAEWETRHFADLPQAPRKGLEAHFEFDGGLTDVSGRYLYGRVLAGDLTYGNGVVNKAADFDGETLLDLGHTGAFDRNRPFSVALWYKRYDKLEMPMLARVADAKTRQGWEILFDDSEPIGDLKRGSHIVVRLTRRWPEDAIEVRTKQRYSDGPARHLVVNYDGSGKASGLKLFMNGEPCELEISHDALSGSFAAENASLQVGNRDLGKPFKGQMDDLRIYNRTLEPAEVEQLAVHEPTRATIMILPAKRSKDQKERLYDRFLTRDAPEEQRQTYATLLRLRKEHEALENVIPTTMVMSEMEKPRDTYLLGRGDYRNHTEKVTPGTPSILPPLPKDAPANRLTLARWLVDPANPLTARVAVNRYWQMYFGTGIVKTAEDFGSQGEAPVHPELLDWLATEFIRSGWDIKAMQRLIVTSAAYRQASRVTPELLEKDPENRLLAHGPRFRLPAEMVRDNALAASGLLDQRISGPSVFPYQPKGLWEELAFGDVYSAQTYTPSHGNDLYRRSMYTFWKRTAPPPSLITFDAPDREKCTVRRAVTNTPLQALVLWNDPTYVESARALAQRVIREAGKDPNRRATLAFRLAAARAPERKELEILTSAARRELAEYRRNPQAAQKLLHVGESAPDAKLDPAELAAWTSVASMILSLDETITKE